MVALDMIEGLVSSGRTKVTLFTAPVPVHEDSLFNQDGLEPLEIIHRELNRFCWSYWRWRGLDFMNSRVILEFELTCRDEGTI